MIISLLMHKDEEVKTETGNKEQETLCVIISIFRSIKSSEDVIDASKTKVSEEIPLMLNLFGFATLGYFTQKSVKLPT